MKKGAFQPLLFVGLRIHVHAAQASLQINAAMAEKNRFRTETPVFSRHGGNKFLQAGNLAAGGGFVNDPFGGCLVDAGDGAGEGLFGRFGIAVRDGGTDLFDQGAHGRADMGVSKGADGCLLVSLDCGLVVGQSCFLQCG